MQRRMSLKTDAWSRIKSPRRQFISNQQISSAQRNKKKHTTLIWILDTFSTKTQEVIIWALGRERGKKSHLFTTRRRRFAVWLREMSIVKTLLSPSTPEIACKSIRFEIIFGLFYGIKWWFFHSALPFLNQQNSDEQNSRQVEEFES